MQHGGAGADPLLRRARPRVRRPACAASSTSRRSPTRRGASAKLYYIGLLVEHSQPELAETFFNSVIKRIAAARPTTTTTSSSSARRSRPSTSSPTRRSTAATTRTSTASGSASRGSSATSAGAGRSPTSTVTSTTCCARSPSGPADRGRTSSRTTRSRCSNSAFYRNKAAYVFGKIVNGHDELPFVVAVLHDGGRPARARHDPARPAADQRPLLALARVLHGRHGGAVRLRRVPALDDAGARRAPSSTRCSASASRERRSSSASCSQHLHHSAGRVRRGARHPRAGDARLHAAVVPVRLQGDPGRVRPRRRTPTGRPSVRSSTMVKHVDRVGRLADTLEFVDLALPRARFSPELLAAASGARAVDDLRRRPARDPPLLRRAADGAAQPLPRPRLAGGARGRRRPTTATRFAISPRRTSSRATCSGGTSASRATAGSSSTTTTRSSTCSTSTSAGSRRRLTPTRSSRPSRGTASCRNDVFPEEFATFLLGDPHLRELFLPPPRASCSSRSSGRTAQRANRARRADGLLPVPGLGSLREPGARKLLIPVSCRCTTALQA